MYETSKAVQRRLHDPNFMSRYFKGHGIDIGSGNDPLEQYLELFPLMTSASPWDKKDGDAGLMEGINTEQFDFVHASHVLEDMRNPNEAIKNWFRVVKPGGYLIVTVPDEDLYEQGIFPSTFNADHKWTFTISKLHSWGKHSINLIDLIGSLGAAAELVKIEQMNATYRYNLDRMDQTRTPIGESAIEFVVRKRPQSELDVGGRLSLSNKTQTPAKPKIALHRPGAIGDIIMTLALVPLLQKKYPDHEIHYFCNTTIGFHLAWLMKGSGLARGIDCTLLEGNQGNYERIINLIGYPLAEGYPEKPMKKHLIQYFADEMGLQCPSEMGLACPDAVPHLTLDAAPPLRGLPLEYATIHPQAGWSVYKNWPKERWEEVIARCQPSNVIDAACNIQFYQIGGENDVPLKGADHTFLGKPLSEAITLMAHSRLHVGVDSWTNHLTNIEWRDHGFTPAIILWGSTQASAAGYARNVNISLGLPCQPCFREDPKISRMPRGPCINPPGQVYEKPQHACMEGITVDRVLEEIEKLWLQK